MTVDDKEYLELILEPIRVCASYKPKFGQGRGEGYDLKAYQALYQSDPFYSWFGLDNPLLYAAHKAAGGMTSVYRQIGIGCERLFRQILQDRLGLSEAASSWEYTTPKTGGGIRTLRLDGRIPLKEIADARARAQVRDWLSNASRSLGVEKKIARSLAGAVFEVRQGYKSKDAKRQNADIANAATAYTKAYLPCAVILSAQIDSDILMRYRGEKWLVITGLIGAKDPLISTYDFMNDVVGYDLAAFFKRNSATLKAEIDKVLKALLTAS